jgi:hypothetical protein
MKSNWPSIDHTILSPSGRASKRARKAALDREAARLFPPGIFPQPQPETTEQRKARLLHSAQELRILASRGMSPRKFPKAAEKLEREAAKL